MRMLPGEAIFLRRRSAIISAWRMAPARGRRSARQRAQTDEIMEAVNRFALRPLGPEEVAVFTLELCNNRVDRHWSVFPLEELEKINRLVPGKPLLERHDVKGSLPRGTFFRSRLHRGPEGYVAVRPDVYVLRTDENAELIANIEGGVYRSTSIGFSFRKPECSICGEDIRRCDHVPGERYGKEVCYYLMRDVVDVHEGSLVSAGSQGTTFVAAHDPTEPRAQARAALDELWWVFGAREEE